MAKQSIRSACVNMASRNGTSSYSNPSQQINVDISSKCVDIDSAMDQAMSTFATTANEEDISNILHVCRRKKIKFNAEFKTLEPIYLKPLKTYFNMAIKLSNGVLQSIVIRFTQAETNCNSIIIRLYKCDKKFQLEFPLELPDNFDYGYVTGLIALANEFAFVNKT